MSYMKLQNALDWLATTKERINNKTWNIFHHLDKEIPHNSANFHTVEAISTILSFIMSEEGRLAYNVYINRTELEKISSDVISQ
jgi:hypothetical protein